MLGVGGVMHDIYEVSPLERAVKSNIEHLKSTIWVEGGEGAEWTEDDWYYRAVAKRKKRK